MQTAIVSPTAFPQDFQNFLQNNALPFPPLPQTLLSITEQTDYNFFGTNSYFPQQHFRFLEDLTRQNTPKNTFSFGITGNLLQSQYAVYFLHYDNLILGISLGWNRTYADQNFERNELEQAFKIAKTCILNTPRQGELTLLINENGCTWQYSDDKNSIHGENLAALLDIIETHSQSEHELPIYLWTRV